MVDEGHDTYYSPEAEGYESAGIDEDMQYEHDEDAAERPSPPGTSLAVEERLTRQVPCRFSQLY